MKRMIAAVVLLTTALLIGGASAQILDLSGRYRCIQYCAVTPPGQFAFVAQNGTELNLTDDAGITWRGYVERPGRIWVHRLDQSAIYSPDGNTIHFERGTIWQRDLGVVVAPVVPVLPPVAAPAPVAPVGPVARATAFDGNWAVTIFTQNGPCDPQYKFGAQIVGGNVVYAGGPANLQGQVAPDGAVWVSVAGGGNRADGEGRLSPVSGGGTWRGQGPLGSCVGVWQATRAG
jgi:hypothetical protein